MQPLLTQQIRCLEQTIGARLFERARSGTVLTAAGEMMAEAAMRILAHVDDDCARTRLVAQGAAGRMRIGLTEELIGSAPYFEILAFMEAHPSLEIETHVSPSPVLLRDLVDQRLDLALANGPLVGDCDRLVIQPLPPTGIAAVVGVSHPWTCRSSIRAAELTTEPLIMRPGWPATPLAIQSWQLVNVSGAGSRVVRTTTSGDIAMDLAANGEGVALLGANVVRRAGRSGVVGLPVDDPEACLAHVLLAPALGRAESASALVARMRNLAEI